MNLSQQTGIGAQFGGKYFCHDVRVIRLPRHGASCPIGVAVSCSADRQAWGKITKEGVFLEELDAIRRSISPTSTTPRWVGRWSRSISRGPWARSERSSPSSP